MAAGSSQALQPERPPARTESWGCALRGEWAKPLSGELPRPRGAVWDVPFAAGDLTELRELVASWARREALSAERVQDLVLAVHEVAANSVRHGGGAGVLRMWRNGKTLVCDVCDVGHIANPGIGRMRPGPDPQNGRGMWIANQLCDLLEVSCSQQGNQVRLHMQPS